MTTDPTSAAVTVRLTAKRCACCGEVKPVAEFSVRRKSRDGLQRDCKACNKARLTAYNATRRLSTRAKWAEIAARNQAEAGP